MKNREGGKEGRMEGKGREGREEWKRHRCFIPSVVVTALYGATRQPACVMYHVQLPLPPQPYLSTSPPVYHPHPFTTPTCLPSHLPYALPAYLLHSLPVYRTHLSVYHHTYCLPTALLALSLLKHSPPVSLPLPTCLPPTPTFLLHSSLYHHTVYHLLPVLLSTTCPVTLYLHAVNLPPVCMTPSTWLPIVATYFREDSEGDD